jgi:DNA-binding transcriptional LysR family regulator
MYDVRRLRSLCAIADAGSLTAAATALDFTQPAISQHLKVLERAGLIERTADAQWRRCTLRTEPLDEASAWVDRHREAWNERFDLLDERLRELKGPTDA